MMEWESRKKHVSTFHAASRKCIFSYTQKHILAKYIHAQAVVASCLNNQPSADANEVMTDFVSSSCLSEGRDFGNTFVASKSNAMLIFTDKRTRDRTARSLAVVRMLYVCTLFTQQQLVYTELGAIVCAKSSG